MYLAPELSSRGSVRRDTRTESNVPRASLLIYVSTFYTAGGTPLSQAFVLALVNEGDGESEVVRTLCSVMDFTHADAGNAASLRWVVDTAAAWVDEQIEEQGRVILSPS